MRLWEIDNQDRSWALMAGIDLDIDNQYENAAVLIILLRNNPHSIIEHECLERLNKIENNLEKILSQDLSNDQESFILKHKAKQMLDHIRNARSSL